MGLGKTLQSLAAIAHLAATGHHRFLVVCPAAVQVNWLNEITKHTMLRSYSLHGSARAEAGQEWLRQGGIAVTTFHTLGRLPDDVRHAPTALVVVDEAHLVKNPGTAIAGAVRAALPRAQGVVFLTGTPMENRVEEFRALVEYLNPRVARRVGAHDALAGARAFRRSVAEVYLRRNQEDVLAELPDLIETESWVEFTAGDTAAYRDAVRSPSLTPARRAAWLAPDSAKLERLRQIVEEAAEDGLKILVFSEFHAALDRVVKGLFRFQSARAPQCSSDRMR